MHNAINTTLAYTVVFKFNLTFADLWRKVIAEMEDMYSIRCPYRVDPK